MYNPSGFLWYGRPKDKKRYNQAFMEDQVVPRKRATWEDRHTEMLYDNFFFNACSKTMYNNFFRALKGALHEVETTFFIRRGNNAIIFAHASAMNALAGPLQDHKKEHHSARQHPSALVALR